MKLSFQKSLFVRSLRGIKILSGKPFPGLLSRVIISVAIIIMMHLACKLSLENELTNVDLMRAVNYYAQDKLL